MLLSAAYVELTRSQRLGIQHAEHTHTHKGSRPTPRDRAHRAVRKEERSKEGKKDSGRSWQKTERKAEKENWVNRGGVPSAESTLLSHTHTHTLLAVTLSPLAVQCSNISSVHHCGNGTSRGRITSYHSSSSHRAGVRGQHGCQRKVAGHCGCAWLHNCLCVCVCVEWWHEICPIDKSGKLCNSSVFPVSGCKQEFRLDSLLSNSLICQLVSLGRLVCSVEQLR